MSGRRVRRWRVAAEGRRRQAGPRRRRRRQRRDRAGRRTAVAAQIRHAALPRRHHGQAGGDGAQDLSLDRQAARGPHQYRGEPRSEFRCAGVLVAPSMETALAAARGDALRRSADAIAVIGGADLYAQTLDRADRLVITHVHARPRGTHAFRPSTRPSGKHRTSRRRRRRGRVLGAYGAARGSQAQPDNPDLPVFNPKGRGAAALNSALNHATAPL